jgi:DNA polymerase V
VFALVDANSFYATCERIFRPDLDGRPIVVLSNNDGCIVARSKEAKALGIDMQKPYFQVRDILKRHNVEVFSSNYTLYADMSQRLHSILRDFAERIETYSIDECFLFWKSAPLEGWARLARRIAETVRRWTGLTVGVGMGETKTLAKLGNHLAKRGKNATGVHVIENTEDATAALDAVELGDIWGISGGFTRRLRRLGIDKPVELQHANPRYVRQHLGVVGERIVYELRGVSCIELEELRPDKQNICCSRSFGKVTSEFNSIREAVVTFASQAAVKLRRQQLVTGKLSVFIQTDRHSDNEQYGGWWSSRLLAPTDDTRLIAEHAAWSLRRIFRPQLLYKKAGVLLMDLCRQSVAQRTLWVHRDPDESTKLMAVVDRINEEHGRGTIRLAAASPVALNPCRTWHMRSDRRSPRYTTRWEELPIISAGNSLSPFRHGNGERNCFVVPCYEPLKRSQ